ncbi:MAG TPA: DAK2 domain-containing protein [Acidimicrobiales bacterium]|nr:DAK2 domain-containing protein [Acidimicrobiales bacterium]
MATLTRLTSADLVATMQAFRDALRDHKERVNRLNVYPVPDGDTGTNMSLTLDSVCNDLSSATPDDMGAVCHAISHGALMGARGNSGVILSQVLRALADGCKAAPPDGAGALEFAKAMTSAAEAAYGAVMRPVEGTILTVTREAAESAAHSAGNGADLLATIEAAKAGGAAALARTPELLPVLKQAGVVDAGGAGLLLLLDAALSVVDGRPLPEAPAETGEAPAFDAAALHSLHGDDQNVGDLRYEVMYFLEAPDDTVSEFKRVWAGIGDSIVVVGGDGIWNCHIHTDDIGAAIEAALDCGRPKNIRVTDLMEQVEEERWVREHEPEAEADETPVATAVVAVATGEGIRRIFRSLGVQQIVAGGQSMNPSTAQILEAVEAAPSEGVVVLPNNKNIIAVAEQVQDLTDKTVRVVKTVGVAEGFAALMEYDPEASADENAETMASCADRVISGEVTRAVRDSEADVGRITEGDYLGISRDGIAVIADTLDGAVCGLIDTLSTDDHEIITLIEGEGATTGSTRRLTEWINEHRPKASVEVHHGGQPLYPYLLSIE